MCCRPHEKFYDENYLKSCKVICSQKLKTANQVLGKISHSSSTSACISSEPSTSAGVPARPEESPVGLPY
jgi:hypothetical protein